MLLKLMILAFTMSHLVSCSKKSDDSEPLVNGMTQAEQAGVAQFFKKFCELGEKYDPAYADYYSDDASIKSTRIYPNGKKREIVISAVKYKKLIKGLMPLAKKRGDKSTFSEVKISKEGAHYRISAQRHSHLKNYNSPYSLLLKQLDDGAFSIIEELTESRPFGNSH